MRNTELMTSRELSLDMHIIIKEARISNIKMTTVSPAVSREILQCVCNRFRDAEQNVSYRVFSPGDRKKDNRSPQLNFELILQYFFLKRFRLNRNSATTTSVK